MKSEPLVSILVACYNHAPYIEACLRSIVCQTYTNIELIVIDDGSSDNSFEIIKQLSDQYGFYAEQQANVGLTRTLNKMLGMAKGKYVCQFGSDDIMLPDKTEKQVTFMEVNPGITVSGGNALLINKDGIIINKRQKFPPYRNITFEHLFAHTGSGIIASTCMIQKKILDDIGGWDPSIPLEDMYMWFKLTSLGYKMVGLNSVLMYYRKHDSNAYKNIRYMHDAMIKTISPYVSHPLYNDAYLRLLRSNFLRASKHDKNLALEILRKIPFSAYNRKVIRGLFYLLKPKNTFFF